MKTSGFGPAGSVRRWYPIASKWEATWLSVKELVVASIAVVLPTGCTVSGKVYVAPAAKVWSGCFAVAVRSVLIGSLTVQAVKRIAIETGTRKARFMGQPPLQTTCNRPAFLVRRVSFSR